MMLYMLPARRARRVIISPAGLRLCSILPHSPFHSDPHSFSLALNSTFTRHFYSHPSPPLLLHYQRIIPCRQFYPLRNLTSGRPPTLSRSHRIYFPQSAPPLSQRPYFPQNPSTHPPASGRTITSIFITICVLSYILSEQALKQAKNHGYSYPSRFLCEHFQFRINSLIVNHSWTLVTHSFLYNHIGHLIIDMVALNSLGPVVARTFGTHGFVVAWICSAAVSAEVEYFGWGNKFCQYMIEKFVTDNNNKDQETIRRNLIKVHHGSTSSLMTFLGMVTCFAPRSKWRPFHIPINIPLYIITTGLGLFSITQLATGELPQIAHEAHLSGLATGFLYYYVWIRRRRRFPFRY